jgi:hypothetical protein
MLTQEALIGALYAALKAAIPACGRFCAAGAEVTSENTYRCWHNGTGVRDTDAVTVYATPVLGLTGEQLVAPLKRWIEGLHTASRVDLNTGKAPGDKG